MPVMQLFTDPGPGEDVRETLRCWPADLVHADCMSLAALRAAMRSNVPTIGLVHLSTAT